MNHRQVLIRAFKVTWHHKYLWVLGFFAGITLGSINYNQYSDNIIQGGAWLFQNLRHILNTQVLFAVILLFISVVIWLIGTLARIGLVYAVGPVDAESDSSIPEISQILRSSTSYFLPTLGMQLVIWSPIILFSLLFVVTAHISSGNISIKSIPADLQSVVGGSSVLLFFLSGAVVYFLPFFLIFVDTIAYRSLILKNTGVKGSIRYSLSFLKNNAKDILVLTSICLIFGLVFLAAIDLILTPILKTLMPYTKTIAPHCLRSNGLYFELTNCLLKTSDNLAVIPLLLVVNIIVAMLTAVWITFQSAVFTIAFNNLSSKSVSFENDGQIDPIEFLDDSESQRI